MPTSVVRVEGLGKKYKITSDRTARYRRKMLRETLVEAAAAPARWLKGQRKASHEEFWALKDVDFDVRPGEVVGVIGRNGAGKSTLLKLLSRVTKPTTGRIELYGRVGSLLEVGTGFHTELSGRDNVYLNGSILGMTRREIDRKFDAIVAFAEVDKFLDTPVKRYSSGMYVRLAFAVAAHLDPEILIVDEVLSVGDAGFQKKCLEKIRECTAGGRTVLLVSHQMNSVRDLCTKAIWLQAGSVRMVGSPSAVIDRYLEESAVNAAPSTWVDLTRAPRTGDGLLQFKAVAFHGRTPEESPIPDGQFRLAVRLHSAGASSGNVRVEFEIVDRYQTKLIRASTYEGFRPLQLPNGGAELRFKVDALHLSPGTYSINLIAGSGERDHDVIGDAVSLEVVPPPGSDGFATNTLVTRDFDYTIEAFGAGGR